MTRFDHFTVFLLKCGIIPAWEVKLRAFQTANRMWDHGGAPANPIRPGDTREHWVERHWEDYIDMAKSSIHFNRPRW